MHLWLLNFIMSFGWPPHVKADPVNRGNLTELFFDEVHKTLQIMVDSPETSEELHHQEHTEEGDIIPSTDRNAVQQIWPTHAIPYQINAEIRRRTSDILSATKMISDQTCLTFHPRTSEIDYLHFKNGAGCASYVGFIGGDQPIFVGSVCSVGNIAHEILHALGFYHEHTRTDRDEYITILNNNIIKGTEQNFIKRHGNTLNVPYDTDSILHYGRYFSSNGLPTIIPLHMTKAMGQRVRLTKLDIMRVRLLYDCDSSRNVTDQQLHWL
ncbi:astacin-like metalloendopeptidase isoform X2 [Boleophthalmus pectinirostris]|uniref:astacin-like metalloendopeptidase isoform X2 n=1 Tax=Boleophthalmus pectinirostris TaxID=150288 RepID=UPI00242BB6B8|nr:astacin-like metalloendopeptidase isoform X2 [Boleophthalmus pectinirostris]